MKKTIILKTLAFSFLLIISFAGISKILVSHDDYRNYQWIHGFYEERENSLDAVYIGGSNVYAFWAAPLAWEQYGITVYPFACNSMPLIAAKYMIKEARKTQPDSLFIVSINGIGTDFPPLHNSKFTI